MILSAKQLMKIMLLILVSILLIKCQSSYKPLVQLKKESHILLVGNNLCSRMLYYGYFETELHVRFPDSTLYIRNMCDGGNTPGFRPHSGRDEPWAFPGAEEFQDELAKASGSEGHLPSEDEWLTDHKADIILGFFGFSESYQGEAGLETWKNELRAFIDHTNHQKYNGKSAPQLVLISPIAFEDIGGKYDVPDGSIENENLKMYADGMKAVATEKNIPFVDVFTPSVKWFGASGDLTVDGTQLSDQGYEKFSAYIVDQIFSGEVNAKAKTYWSKIHEAVLEKNWFWHNDFKIPNGIHVFGRRYNPFGPDNYPDEVKKIREMTDLRDQAIWEAAKGNDFDLVAADAKTHILPAVESNFKPGDNGSGEGEYLYGDDALATIRVPDGYKIDLFASEKEFSELANPVQISFDNAGRLWVAVMPTYPHYKPGDPKPNDKLIILEDTDKDGKADKRTVFADGLHIPVGFELAPEGVYISQGTNLKLFRDTDGDDRADEVDIIMSGFDDHDTHHVISAFCADPSGAIYMGEGVFLHTNVETSYGTVRATNGGFYRFSPQRRHLERTAQLSIPNPWGIAFDDWGQPIFAETSGPAVRWMMPGTVKSRYGVATHKSYDLIDDEDKVRPTSGLEFISSRHFPAEVQGDIILNNSIGFLGCKQHQVMDDGTGFDFKFRQDLFVSDDQNFRPVDMEIAPDGSLYIVDWHNVLVGHMQHNARDPYRDHVHGRIYRVTYPSRPLVEPAKIVDATIEELLDNLKLPEYRSRYRTKRELRARDQDKVSQALVSWIENIDTDDPKYEHHLVEAMWTYWGLNIVNEDLIEKVMSAHDFRARAAAVRVVRYNGHLLENQTELLKRAAADEHGRVRLEAIVAASWLDKEAGVEVIAIAEQHPLDKWMVHAHETAFAHLNDKSVKPAKKAGEVPAHLKGDDLLAYASGKEIYGREGFCGTCHQENGKGLSVTGYPPLAGTNWTMGNEERLVKIALKGLYGPMRVGGLDYAGTVPMTPYEGMLNDEEIAAVLTYVRNSFGNEASVIKPEFVKKIRAKIKDKKGFYDPADLLKDHPLEAEKAI